MPRKTKEKSYAAMYLFFKANEGEWERIVNSQEVQSEIQELRKRFGIEISKGINQIDNFDIEHPNVIIKVSEQFGELIKKHSLEKVEDNLWSYLWYMPSYNFSLGYPKCLYGTKWGDVLLITPETDIENPIIIRYIRNWQRYKRDRDDCPPQPTKVNGKLDWQPVREWLARHPFVDKKELARLLHKDYTYVKKALGNIGNELSG